MAQAVVDPRPASDTSGYAPFSPRLAPSFIVAGGLLAIAGGLGLWVRVTSVTAGTVHQSASLTGAGSVTGWFIAALGIAAVAASIVRFPSSRWLGLAVSIAAVTLIALRVADLSRVASTMAFGAGPVERRRAQREPRHSAAGNLGRRGRPLRHELRSVAGIHGEHDQVGDDHPAQRHVAAAR